MPTTTNKQRLLNQIFTVLKKRYEPAEPEARPMLEQFLYAICREGATREQADRAYRALGEHFFDWNELRVSSHREVEEVLGDLPRADLRAQRLISLLQEVFETTFSFDLETSLHKKGVKETAKRLSRYQAASDFAVAWIVQQALGGHAIPVDGPSLRVLKRLGLIEGDQEDPEALRASLEHLVPKAKGYLLTELISALAQELCWEEEPQCTGCPLLDECPTGQEVSRGTLVSSRANRPKPR
ncbi:MAG: endonuclease [Planctomycetes bacterium]|nr:endonuclease [Planctomycetota bacterium]